MHSKSIAVVQSSGMGKSRMIHEASALVFTIPINIRGAKEVKGELYDKTLSWSLAYRPLAYPPPDEAVINYFDGYANKTDKRLQVEYAILFTEIF